MLDQQPETHIVFKEDPHLSSAAGTWYSPRILKSAEAVRSGTYVVKKNDVKIFDNHNRLIIEANTNSRDSGSYNYVKFHPNFFQQFNIPYDEYQTIAFDLLDHLENQNPLSANQYYQEKYAYHMPDPIDLSSFIYYDQDSPHFGTISSILGLDNNFFERHNLPFTYREKIYPLAYPWWYKHSTVDYTMVDYQYPNFDSHIISFLRSFQKQKWDYNHPFLKQVIPAVYYVFPIVSTVLPAKTWKFALQMGYQVSMDLLHTYQPYAFTYNRFLSNFAFKYFPLLADFVSYVYKPINRKAWDNYALRNNRRPLLYNQVLSKLSDTQLTDIIQLSNNFPYKTNTHLLTARQTLSFLLNIDADKIQRYHFDKLFTFDEQHFFFINADKTHNLDRIYMNPLQFTAAQYVRNLTNSFNHMLFYLPPQLAEKAVSSIQRYLDNLVYDDFKLNAEFYDQHSHHSLTPTTYDIIEKADRLNFRTLAANGRSTPDYWRYIARNFINNHPNFSRFMPKWFSDVGLSHLFANIHNTNWFNPHNHFDLDKGASHLFDSLWKDYTSALHSHYILEDHFPRNLINLFYTFYPGLKRIVQTRQYPYIRNYISSIVHRRDKGRSFASFKSRLSTRSVNPRRRVFPPSYKKKRRYYKKYFY